MKPLVSFLLTAATLLPVMTAAAFDRIQVNGRPLDISGRFLSGQLDKRLVQIHTNKENGQFHEFSHSANVSALRRHARCAMQPDTCANRNTF